MPTKETDFSEQRRADLWAAADRCTTHAVSWYGAATRQTRSGWSTTQARAKYVAWGLLAQMLRSWHICRDPHVPTLLDVTRACDSEYTDEALHREILRLCDH